MKLVSAPSSVSCPTCGQRLRPDGLELCQRCDAAETQRALETEHGTRLTTPLIIELLDELVERLVQAEIATSLTIVGGAAVALSTRPDRQATVDIDTFGKIGADVEGIIVDMATKWRLPSDWLNSKAQMFRSVTADRTDETVFRKKGQVEIRLLGAASLLAMKLRSGRLGKDGDDIISLFDELDLSSVKEAQKVMDAYYDGEENMAPTAKALLERHVSR